MPPTAPDRAPRTGWVRTIVAASITSLLGLGGLVAVSPAAVAAAPSLTDVRTALDSSYIRDSKLIGDPRGAAVLTKKLYGMPGEGSSALILSTGDASLVANPTAANKTPRIGTGDRAGADLAGAGSADKNDLTQLKLTLDPPDGAEDCMAFDFMFFSEEYPNFKGREFNDIFTAELNRSEFSLQGSQVIAPNNFAFDADREPLSVNTFNKFTSAPLAGLNGRSDRYRAVTKLEWPDAEDDDKPIDLYLSVQDLGDSNLDSAVVLDNLTFFQSEDCADDNGVTPIVDTDGDSLPDDWETKGIDYNGDGKPDLDLKKLGADPKHKDIFLEIDWMYEDPKCTGTGLVCVKKQMRDKKPRQAALDKVIKAFADAPVTNPDGKNGVTLHIDAGPGSTMDAKTKAPWGELAGGNALPYADELGSRKGDIYDWSQFAAIKAKNFDAKRGDVFHYVVCANKQADGVDSSGKSRGIPASDFFLSDATIDNGRFTIQDEAGTLMHELGHNLHLRHAGDSNDPSYRVGYYSIMNYSYQFVGVDRKGKLDYSRGTDPDPAPSSETASSTASSTPGGTPTSTASGTPSGTPSATRPAVVEFNDWDHLVFNGGSIGSLGAGSPPPTTTRSDEQSLTEADKRGELHMNGDGSVTLVGPTLVAKDVAQQHLIADVSNVGQAQATYRVVLGDTPWGTGKEVTVTVPAKKTSRVRIPIDVKQTGAAVSTTVNLYDGDTLLSSSQLGINAVDPSDPPTAALVRKTLDEVATEPPAGLDPEVSKAVTVAMQPGAAKVDRSIFSVALIAALGVGVLLVGLVILLLRRRSRASS